jgi:hypothetical protein
MASTALTQRSLKWDHNRGRNPIDDPTTLPDDISIESRNVLLDAVGLGTRRPGVGQAALAGSLSTGGVRALGYGRVWQSFGNERTIVGVDGSSPNKLLMLLPGTSLYSLLPPPDALTGSPKRTHIIEHNGYIYVTYASAVDRLHAIVTNFLASNPIVRTGLPAPAAPTVADGGGAGVAVVRYYRIQWRLSSGLRIAASNLGASQVFTPAGANSATITKPATPTNENPTGWVVYGSADNANFYDLSGVIAIGTATYSDTATPSTYFSGRTAAPPEGTYTPWPSVKYLVSTGDRLVGFGVHATGTLEGLSVIPGRVYFSPVANTTDTNDNERISVTSTVKGYIDLAGSKTGKIERALAGPIDNVILAFFDVGIWSLVPTGIDTAPFRRVRLDPSKGACGQWSTFVGEDERGDPAVYFLDPLSGPTRYATGRGFEWLGYDVQDLAGYGRLVEQAEDLHGVWDAALKCARWWVELDDDREPTIEIVFYPCHGRSERRGDVRGGWVVHDGLVGQASCSTSGLPPNAFVSDVDHDLIVLGLAPGIADTVIASVDGSIDTTDNPMESPDAGTGYEAYVLSRAITSALPQLINQAGHGYVMAKTAAALRLQQSAMVDFAGVYVASSDESFEPSPATQTRALKRMPSLSGLTNFYAMSIRLGDAVAGMETIDFTTPGTVQWESPYSGILVVEAIGGGGGSRSTVSANAAAGGGGGSYARVGGLIRRGDVVSITVGAGGAPGATQGANGGTSSFGSVCIAPGGSGADLSTGGAGGVVGTGDQRYAGGAGGAGGCGALAVGAGGGGAGGTLGAGGVGGACNIGTAGTGVTPGGRGGVGAVAGAIIGNNGVIYGGGAGGNGAGGSGGASGANGLVRVHVLPVAWTIDRWLGSIEAGSEA